MPDPNKESERPVGTTDAAALSDVPRRQSTFARRIPLWTTTLALLVVIVILAGYYFGLDEAMQVRYIEAEIQSWGSLGVVASIALMVLHSFVPFPAEFIAIANGMLFGLGWGVVITWTGAMLGAFAAFGLARLLGRPFVARMVRGKDWERMDDWATDHGWKILLISRFIPVIAFNLINYAAGLTGVSWFTFTWTTGVGILPATILMVLVGDNIELMTWEVWLLLLAGGIVLWLVVGRGVFRLNRLTSQDKR